MPRPRKDPLFELAGQWIGRVPGSPNLYRFWTEPGAGRSSRASLGTGDLAAAKVIFAKAVLLNGPKTPDSPLSAVLESYCLERTDKLPSAKHARLAKRTLLTCWGETIRCSQVTEAKQKEFAQTSIGKGHSLSYISRNLSVAAAAIKHASLPMKILFGKQQIAAKWSLQTKAPRRVFIPSDDELARFLSADLPEAFFRWCITACLTGARPEAVLDLAQSSRIRDVGLLNLNPEGRPQNKKYRPTVREPKALKAWLDRWEKECLSSSLGSSSVRLKNTDGSAADSRSATAGKSEVAACRPASLGKNLDRYCTYWSVESVQTASERARAKTKIPMSAYSFRHKVVTVLRKARIPEDQIAIQMGHKKPDTAITAGYGEWSPDYLKPVAKALDAWWGKLAKKAKVQLLAKTQPKRKRRILKLRKAA